LLDETTKGDPMDTKPAAHSPTDVADELSGWLVGGGIVTMALFPFAIPILLLTAVFTAPLVILGIAAALPVGIVAGVVLAIRTIGRRLRGRPGGWGESRTVSPSRLVGR
jgi:hypothetical protein